jgi:hypothetical protein
VSPRIPMWFTYFRSKATLERQLASERTLSSQLCERLQEMRERLERTEIEFARLRDATLLKQGVIHAPLRTEPQPASPLASFVGALGLTEYGPPPSASRELMPDE